jgi:DNA repair protein RecO
MLEAVDQLAQERNSVPRVHELLLGALRTLDATDAPLVVPAFLLKLLALEGLRPLVDRCVACGADTDLVAFEPVEGGALCREHRRGIPVSPEAFRLLGLVLGGQLGAALNEPASPATHEVSRLATEAMEHHLERRLRSAALLECGREVILDAIGVAQRFQLRRERGQPVTPSRTAHAATSARDDMASLERMFDTWTAAVRGEM